jgi:hypothetical protein
MSGNDNRARNRFAIISLTRLTGGFVLMLGILAASGRFESVPKEAGILLTFLGAFGFALAPRMLARRWRSPPP